MYLNDGLVDLIVDEDADNIVAHGQVNSLGLEAGLEEGDLKAVLLVLIVEGLHIVRLGIEQGDLVKEINVSQIGAIA